jgi:adenylate cyclase
MINGLFSLLDPIVRKYGGIVDKYLGDGALVTWGTLGASAPNSKDLMNCGVDLLKSLELHNQSLKQRGLMPIKIGIGLHIGEALVGTIGSSERLEYTAIGPAVNLASRLESLCKMHDAEIVASDEMIRELSHHPDTQWHRIDGVQVRGIERHISIWTYKYSDSQNFEYTTEYAA